MNLNIFKNKKTKKLQVFISNESLTIISSEKKIDTIPFKDSFLKTIESLNDLIKLKGIEVSIILDYDLYKLANIELPNVEKDMVKPALYWTLEENLGINPDDVVYDVSFVKNNNSHGFIYYSNILLIEDIMTSFLSFGAKINNIIPKTSYFVNKYFKDNTDSVFLLLYQGKELQLFLVSDNNILLFRGISLSSDNMDYLETEDFAGKIIDFLQDSFSYAKRYYSNYVVKKIVLDTKFLPDFCKETLENQFDILIHHLFENKNKLEFVPTLDSCNISLIVENLIEPNITYSSFKYKKLIKYSVFVYISLIPFMLYVKNYYQQEIEKLNLEIDNEKTENQSLQQKIKTVVDDKLVKEFESLERIFTLKKSLVEEAEQSSELLNKIEKTLPNDVWIEELEYKNGLLSILGHSKNTSSIEIFIESLKKENILNNTLFNLTIESTNQEELIFHINNTTNNLGLKIKE